MATAQTSVGMRDVTTQALKILREDKVFQVWRNDQLEDLAQHGPFLQALGRALVHKVDWTELRERRNRRQPKSR